MRVRRNEKKEDHVHQAASQVMKTDLETNPDTPNTITIAMAGHPETTATMEVAGMEVEEAVRREVEEKTRKVAMGVKRAGKEDAAATAAPETASHQTMVKLLQMAVFKTEMEALPIAIARGTTSSLPQKSKEARVAPFR